MCSGQQRRSVTRLPAIAPAIKNVPASIRSAITVCSAPCSSRTPSITIRRVPAPSIFAPIRIRKFARSSTSGSIAAPSITVVPGTSTAAIIRLSVPSTVDPCLPRMFTSRPPMPSTALMCMFPPCTDTLAPSCSNPRKCRSTGRSPITQPPGSDTIASPVRPSSGPITQIDARIRRTRSYGASLFTDSASTITVPLARSTCAPRLARICVM